MATVYSRVVYEATVSFTATYEGTVYFKVVYVATESLGATYV